MCIYVILATSIKKKSNLNKKKLVVAGLTSIHLSRREVDLDFQLPQLARLGPGHLVGMDTGPVGLQVDVGAEGVGELLRGATLLLTQVVLLTKVLLEVVVITEGEAIKTGRDFNGTPFPPNN